MLVEREAWLNAQLDEANKENKELHEDLVSTMKDLGGCKVTIKYMDKEIIGRIQQLQLMQQGLDKHPNTLTWNTIEAEISLNRHKVLYFTATQGTSLYSHTRYFTLLPHKVLHFTATQGTSLYSHTRHFTLLPHFAYF